MNKTYATIIVLVMLAAGFFAIDQLKTVDVIQSRVVQKESTLRKDHVDRIHQLALAKLNAYRADKKSEPSSEQVAQMWADAKAEVNQ